MVERVMNYKGVVWRIAVRIGRTLFVLIFILSLLIGFGLSGRDYTAMRGFVDASDRWQYHPEFRAVAMDYCIRGSDAMRSHPLGIRCAEWIMGIRSLPGIPAGFAVNPTSRLHYENFTKGPLSAYMHLCSEQEPDYFESMEGLGKSRSPSIEESQAWLAGLKWDFEVKHDRGAGQSVMTMVRDSDAYRGYGIKAKIDDRLPPFITAIATELGFEETTIDTMSPEQQLAVLERLDGYIKHHDAELWRTKQVSDLRGGLWAQVFAPPYKILMGPYLTAVVVGKWLVAGMSILLVIRQVMRGRQEARLAQEALATALQARAAKPA